MALLLVADVDAVVLPLFAVPDEDSLDESATVGAEPAETVGGVFAGGVTLGECGMLMDNPSTSCGKLIEFESRWK
jgi:hypothetical protein